MLFYHYSFIPFDKLAASNLHSPFEVISLVYHRFGDDRYPSTNTSVKELEAQLAYLQKKGFRSYTASELVVDNNLLQSSFKKVLVTVDDGFLSFLKYGWPVFKKYGIKVTLFINTESVGWKDYLNWEQLNQLIQEGVEIGNHSHGHSHFVSYADDKRAKMFGEDLCKANRLFKEHIGVVPTVYAYPYGEYTQELSQELKNNGYVAAFAQNSGVYNHSSNLYGIPRFPVAGSFVTLEQFKSKVKMGALPVNADDQWPIILGAESKVYFKLRLSGDFEASDINCFVNGKSTPTIFQNKNGILLFELDVPRNRRRTLVTITTKNKSGVWCWFSKLIIDPRIEE